MSVLKINSVSLDVDRGTLFITVFIDGLGTAELSDNARVSMCKGIRTSLPQVAEMPTELAVATKNKRRR